MLLANH
jgi:hypothetical protein